jgi:hypothetical protein
MLMPSMSGVGLLSKHFRRSIIWEGPVKLKLYWGTLGRSGIYESGSVAEWGIEFAILEPMFGKKLLNSSAIAVGLVRVQEFVLISVMGLWEFLPEVTSLRISQVFLDCS